MSEKPTEDTYVAEFISVIKEVGRALDFDAEANWRSPSGKLFGTVHLSLTSINNTT